MSQELSKPYSKLALPHVGLIEDLQYFIDKLYVCFCLLIGKLTLVIYVI